MSRVLPQNRRNLALLSFLMAAAVLCLGGPDFHAGERGCQSQSSSFSRSSSFRGTPAGWTRASTSRRARNSFSRAKARSPSRRGIPRPPAVPRAMTSRGFSSPCRTGTWAAWPARSARLLAVRTDEKTGEEVRDELIQLFLHRTRADRGHAHPGPALPRGQRERRQGQRRGIHVLIYRRRSLDSGGLKLQAPH